MTLNTKYQDKLLTIINKFLPGCTVYLFGSRARDQEVTGSDIDVALDTGAPIAYKTMLNLEMAIDETTIPMKVDVVDIHRVDSALKAEILREGIRWTS